MPDNNGGSYLIQLAPRLSSPAPIPFSWCSTAAARKKASDTLKRFSDEAAKHGFILVAPLWTGDRPLVKTEYKYSFKEHALVLDTLRDLRRRFQIDSDRVFMFGWEDGANLVYDIGLAHPDLFAGIVPMNGVLKPFARRFYYANAQYLPMYIIDGERYGNAPKANRDLLKDWTREPYHCTYVEYHGRGSEWFGAEVPNILNWMSRKKRHTPMKQLGREGHAGQLGEETHTSRTTDDHFYWLSGAGIGDRCLPRITAALQCLFQAGDLAGGFDDRQSASQGPGQELVSDQRAIHRPEASDAVDHAQHDGVAEPAHGARQRRRARQQEDDRSEPGRDAGGTLPHGRSAAAVFREVAVLVRCLIPFFV